MDSFERIAIKVRHMPFLEAADRLWDRVRPLYDAAIRRIYVNGLLRTINGTDTMLIAPEARGISEMYEPRVWKRLMDEVRPGDVIADVGAYIGLYTVALAKRTGGNGKVFAFEASRKNFEVLRKNVGLNGISGRTEVFHMAVGDTEGDVTFRERPGTESGVVPCGAGAESRTGPGCEYVYRMVRAGTLDRVMAGSKVDIIKIDVEGYEAGVLSGARDILYRREGCPRAVFIEAHPYAWTDRDTAGRMLGLLTDAGYRVEDIDGEPVRDIRSYGEIAALKERLESSKDRKA